MRNKGIIVASSYNQQWLLPWWWFHYNLHNSYPVTFVNLGDLSKEAIAWCKKKGNLIEINQNISVSNKTQVDPENREIWEKIFKGDIWYLRNFWFLKPLAMALSPYDETIFLDLDCEVLKPLEPIFDYAKSPAKLSIARESIKELTYNRKQGLLKENEIGYNSGVVAFQKNCTLIGQWKEIAIRKNHLFLSDQDIITSLINKRSDFIELPSIYNCNPSRDKDTAIFHWKSFKKELLHTVGKLYRLAFFDTFVHF